MSFIEVAKGAAIGVANIIPGVSGGTVALMLGIYEKLTEAVGEFALATKEKKIEYTKFLAKIGVGVLIGVGIFAKLIDYLYENFSEETSFFFLGLIVASLPLIATHRESEKISPKSWVSFVVGFLIVLAIIMFAPEKQEVAGIVKGLTVGYGAKLFISGAIAGGSMVIPGISGSLMLLLMGEYYNVLALINSIGSMTSIMSLGVFGFGTLFGVVAFAKIIDKLLKTKKDQTILFIMGLIVASLIEVYPGIAVFSLKNIIIDLVVFSLGVITVKAMK